MTFCHVSPVYLQLQRKQYVIHVKDLIYESPSSRIQISWGVTRHRCLVHIPIYDFHVFRFEAHENRLISTIGIVGAGRYGCHKSQKPT